MPEPLRIFAGLDPRQMISWTVLQNSIFMRASVPVSLTPVSNATFPCKRPGLTGFTWSRFLVPWACGFKGLALFMDVDMLVRCDIKELFDLANDEHAVMVSKNILQFEWASLMLFNCAHADNAKLTPEFVETAQKLHSIAWTSAVGELPGTFNHLAQYDKPDPDAKIIHHTQGVPAWPETEDTEFSDDWRQQAQIAFSAQPWATLMGNSVHAKPVYERLAKKGAA